MFDLIGDVMRASREGWTSTEANWVITWYQRQRNLYLTEGGEWVGAVTALASPSSLMSFSDRVACQHFIDRELSGIPAEVADIRTIPLV